MNGLRRRLLPGLLLLAAVGWSFFDFWSAATAPAPAAPAAVDAVVVLTGGGDRVAAGLDLLAAGRAGRLYISGVNAQVSLDDLLAAQSEEAAALAGRIEIGRAHDTLGNAEETAAWSVRNGVASVLLVTGYYHMPRSEILLRQAAPGLEIWPAPVEPAAAGRSEWWRSGRGISLILGEWLKYTATRMGFPR